MKPGAAAQACDDLRWLGLDWDEGPITQTDRLPLYEAALRQLQARRLAIERDGAVWRVTLLRLAY